MERTIVSKADAKAIAHVRVLLKSWRCDDCKAGKPCKPGKNIAYIEDENGKRRWFCNLGCALLQCTDEGIVQTLQGYDAPN